MIACRVIEDGGGRTTPTAQVAGARWRRAFVISKAVSPLLLEAGASVQPSENTAGVAEPVLIEALTAGAIRAAVLDVVMDAGDEHPDLARLHGVKALGTFSWACAVLSGCYRRNR